MPFVDTTTRRNLFQSATPDQFEDASGWGESYSAGLGLVVDEELSVSAILNREAFETRNQLIREKAEAGEIDLDSYRTQRGPASSIDYGRVARDYESDEIKTDDVLNQERTDLLARRRKYAEGVLSNGSGMAQFLGAMNGYMLDPINAISAGMGSAMVTARGIGTLARTAQSMKNAAIIDGAAELGIQTFVYDHKQSIDSPYSAGDALANIAMAAGGSAVLSGVATGLGSWFRKVDEFADQLPQTPDVEYARANIKRTEQILKDAPPAKDGQTQTESDIAYLEEYARRQERSAKATLLPEDFDTTQPTIGPTPPELSPIGQRLQARMDSEPEAIRAEYAELEDSMGGKVISTDIARELSPEYMGNRSLAADVHVPSSKFTKQLYTEKLAEAPKRGELDLVTITAGGAGAGKTTAMEGLKADLLQKSQIVYDTNMDKLDKGIKMIDEALEAGKEVALVMVKRDPLDAFENGVMKRAMRQEAEFGTGRTVPLETVAKTHVDSAKTIRNLADHYKDDDRVWFQVLDNSHGLGKARQARLEDIGDLDYDEIIKALRKANETAFEEGRISQNVYEGFRGGREGQKPGESSGGQKADGGRRAANDGRAEPERDSEGLTPSEQSFLSDEGLLDSYNRALREFENLENPVAWDGDSIIPADPLIKQLDEAADGLEAVRVCAIG